MKILVTGGAGYVGSTVTSHLLEQGHSVRAVDILFFGGDSLLPVWGHPHFEFVKGDVRDEKIQSKCLEGCDAVVHLAAIVGDPACAKDENLATSINLTATKQLIDKSKGNIDRFIFASTCSNYGKMPDPDQLANEETELRPVSHYAKTKVEVEKYVLESKSSLCGTNLRFSTVYGVAPRMRFDLTVNEFTRDIYLDKKLTVFGEQFWRPYVHVRDIAKAVNLVLSSPEDKIRGEVFNVGGTDQNFQKKQIVEKVVERIPDAKIDYVHKDEDPRDYRVSFEKIKETLGLNLDWNLDKGIDEIYQLVSSDLLRDPRAPFFKNI